MNILDLYIVVEGVKIKKGWEKVMEKVRLVRIVWMKR